MLLTVKALETQYAIDRMIERSSTIASCMFMNVARSSIMGGKGLHPACSGKAWRAISLSAHPAPWRMCLWSVKEASGALQPPSVPSLQHAYVQFGFGFHLTRKGLF